MPVLGVLLGIVGVLIGWSEITEKTTTAAASPCSGTMSATPPRSGRATTTTAPSRARSTRNSPASAAAAARSRRRARSRWRSGPSASTAAGLACAGRGSVRRRGVGSWRASTGWTYHEQHDTLLAAWEQADGPPGYYRSSAYDLLHGTVQGMQFIVFDLDFAGRSVTAFVLRLPLTAPAMWVKRRRSRSEVYFGILAQDGRDDVALTSGDLRRSTDAGFGRPQPGPGQGAAHP